MIKYFLLNKIVGIFLILVIFASAGVYPLLYRGNKIVHTKVINIDVQYAADFSDDRTLMGAAHNVFIGKVIRQTGSKERGIGPETQFQVQVIENIKGNLKGMIVVNQQGGYKDGVQYVVERFEVGKENGYFLQSGSTYLFTTRYNDKEDWYTLNSYPTANKLLSDNQKLTEDQLKNVAEGDVRVKELRGVYPYEVLIKEDIEANNVRNSYKSL